MSSADRTQLTIFLPSLEGGGAERVMVNLAAGFSDRGVKTDLVVDRITAEFS